MTKTGYRSFVTRSKDVLREVTPLVRLKRKLRPNADGMRGESRVNLLRTFPLYRPYSEGNYDDRSVLTIQAINQVFPFLSSLAETLGYAALPVEVVTAAANTNSKKAAVAELGPLLDRHGSDKANRLNYHYLYGSILESRSSVQRIFEIGLGTNNTDIVSNMGYRGTPGASLRAFRDFCPEANVYGADIDRRVLFEEERITTRFVDQTDPASFEALLPELPRDFDLVIDDGLHSPNANVESLRFGLQLVKVGGWVVIEDIGSAALPLWQVVAAMMPDSHRPHLFRAGGGSILFAVQRLR